MYFTFSLMIIPSPLNFIPQAGVNSGQTGKAEANFAGQPPIVACPSGFQPLDPYARLDGQGMPTPLWQPFKTWLEYDGGDYIRQVMIFKKARFA